MSTPDTYVFLCGRKRDMVISSEAIIHQAQKEELFFGVPAEQHFVAFGVPKVRR